MDRLQAMQVFIRVVEANGFGKAAESLAMPPSTVTRVVKELEAYLSVQLLQRTTRHISLTADGSLYYDQCVRLLGEIEALESSFPGSSGRAQGRLRIDMTASFARMFVLPSLRDFQTRHPEVELLLSLGDRPIDLVQDGVDCVIRSGVPHDSATLVARRIAGFEWVVCASPDYLQRHPAPRTLDDLRDHQAVGYLSPGAGRSAPWHFVIDGEERAVQVAERVAVNDTDAYVTGGLAGLGLIRAASYLVLPHLRSGQLRRVLPGLTAPTVPLSILYPQSRHISPTVRAFSDWIAALMREQAGQWQLP